ncbi:MAG: helix-hairpin-helix domain-containing protein [Thermoleophilia bacterium]|nr:helix-hairpin-helix domain-containing protein [Thermoleophilia bacterium]
MTVKPRSEILESIPGVGPKIALKLQSIGIRRVSDLKDANPEKLYSKLEKTMGVHVDPCVLYVFRTAVYYSSRKKHDPEKLKWWNWKDIA